MTNIEKIKSTIENHKCRSAWDKGVSSYALEILDTVEERMNYEGHEPHTIDELKDYMLNGAETWQRSSWGGCYEIYDVDIAKRLCTPSELKKTNNGERRPNSQEEWLDVQARALLQAARRIIIEFKKLI